MTSCGPRNYRGIPGELWLKSCEIRARIVQLSEDFLDLNRASLRREFGWTSRESASSYRVSRRRLRPTAGRYSGNRDEATIGFLSPRNLSNGPCYYWASKDAPWTIWALLRHIVRIACQRAKPPCGWTSDPDVPGDRSSSRIVAGPTNFIFGLSQTGPPALSLEGGGEGGRKKRFYICTCEVLNSLMVESVLMTSHI